MDDPFADLAEPVRRPRRGGYDDLIAKHAQRTGLDPELVRAVVRQESGGNPRAVSPKGAQGIGQLMPATARRFGVRDPYDPDENLRGATDYLKFLNDRFKGNRDLVLAGYNAGEGAVEKFGNRVPPYRETRNYVKSINARLGQRDRFADVVDKPQRASDPFADLADQPPGQTPLPASQDQSARNPPQSPASPQVQPVPDDSRILGALNRTFQQGVRQARRQAGQSPRQPRQPAASPADLRRLDEPEVARIQRLQAEEAGRIGTFNLRGRGLSSAAARAAASRASTEQRDEERRTSEQPQLDELTRQYRKQIREAARITPNYGPTQWFQEALTKGEAGLLELGAATARATTHASRNPAYTRQLADNLRLHAQAMQQAAIEEGADRNVVSRTLQDATAGLISTAPELAAMSLGAPPIATFAAGGGARAYGRGERLPQVAKEAAHGAATGALFELPIPSRITSTAGRTAAKAATVGGATIGMELTTGTPPEQAIASGVTNAAFAGHGELSRGGRRGEVRGGTLPSVDERRTAYYDVKTNDGQVIASGVHENDLPAYMRQVPDGGTLRIKPLRTSGPDVEYRWVKPSEGAVSEAKSKPQPDVPALRETVKPERAVPEVGPRGVDVPPRSEVVAPEYRAADSQLSEAMARPRQSGLVKSTITPKPLWEMTPKELELAREVEVAAERNMLARHLGEDAERFINLNHQRLRGVAGAEAKLNELTSRLTKEQESAIDDWYAESERRPLPEDYNRHLERLREVEGFSGSEEDMAELLARTIPKLGTGRQSLSRYEREEAALAESTVRYAAQVARETGLDSRKLLQLTKERAGSLYGPDTEFMLSSLLNAEAANATTVPQRFYHRDYGEVAESPNQRRVGKGRVRVAAEDGTEHVIKRASLTGAGNQRAVPIRLQPETPAEALERAIETFRATTEGREAEGSPEGQRTMPIRETQPAEPPTEQPALLADEQGNPLTLYHHTTKEARDAIVESGFDLGKGRARLSDEAVPDGVFFTPSDKTPFRDPDIEFARIDANLSVTNPLRVENRTEIRRWASERDAEYATITKDLAKYTYEEMDRLYTDLQGSDRAAVQRAERELQSLNERATRGRAILTDLLKREGYDGLVMERDEAGPQVTKTYVALDPRQVRIKQEVAPSRETVPAKPETIQPARETKPPAGGTTEPPLETVSARKVQLSADRAALDLPELPAAERKSWQQSLAEAKPERATLLADEVLNRPRAFNDSETASLVVRAQQIKNEHAAKMRETGAATDPAVIAQRRSEIVALEREFDKLTQATRLSGTEKGRTLAAQKLTINQDYDLVSLVARFKAAAGREPTARERAKIEELSQRNAELETRLTEANDRLTQQRIQQEINRSRRRGQRAETKVEIETEWRDLTKQFAELRQREASFFKSEKGAFDPAALALIARMVRNRVRAGVTDAAQLVDDVHAIVGGDKRELRDAISGYRTRPAQRQSDLQRQLNTLKSELRRFSTAEDLTSGARSPRQEGPAGEFKRDRTRQRQIEKQITDLEQQMQSGQFRDNVQREPPRYTAETHRLQKALDATRAEYERLKYRATATTGEKVTDTLLGLGNTPKTLLSMGDLSALLRQGGYGSVTHPVLSTKAAQDMVRSFSERGFANVEAEIKDHPLFEEAKRNGVEFTGIDRLDPRLSKREEGYLGSGFIDTIAKGRLNPLRLVKGVKDISERTFVSFLDSQRMRIYAQQAGAIRSMGLTEAQVQSALKTQARLVNITTGRGSLGARGNAAAPVLNMAMFSPRLLASRVQLLNKMFNPVAWRNTPPGARKLMMIDNVKFLGFTALTLGLAKAAGAGVSLDPDDSEFLKIKVGNMRYDTLTGLQQPMRLFLRMVGYGGGQFGGAMRGGELYSGDPSGKILVDFTRSKASPEAGYLWDAIEGKNRLTGKKFEAGKDAARLLAPLPMQDFAEAIKTDGVARGFVEALPSLVGVGAQTYKGAAEKPTTRAEKLSRRFLIRRMPDEARTQEEIDADQKRADLRARSRRGEDVSGELATLKGVLTDRQAKAILAARNHTRLQEDVNHLGIKDTLLVYSVATPAQRAELKDTLVRKARLADVLPPDEQAQVRAQLAEFGVTGTGRPTRTSRESRTSRSVTR